MMDAKDGMRVCDWIAIAWLVVLARHVVLRGGERVRSNDVGL